MAPTRRRGLRRRYGRRDVRPSRGYLVGDDAFLGSMIPHHSRAIHMCQEAELSDPQIIDLCGRIIESQRQEISEMEAIIARRD